MKNNQLRIKKREPVSKAWKPMTEVRPLLPAPRAPRDLAVWHFAFLIINFALLPPAFGQAAQIKERAKELVNQNNVRQGVPPPASPPPHPAAPNSPGNPAVLSAAALQAQNISKIKADLAGFKPGSPVTPEQKQQFIKDLAVAARTTKPALPTVTRLVDALIVALGENPLAVPEQQRLAQNLNSVFNSKPLPVAQFDAIIADVQAILQVGGVKRSAAMSVAGDLKAVGLEVRR